MSKDPRVFLAHILERADRIAAYVRDGHAPFLRAAIAALLPPLDQLERELSDGEPE